MSAVISVGKEGMTRRAGVDAWTQVIGCLCNHAGSMKPVLGDLRGNQRDGGSNEKLQQEMRRGGKWLRSESRQSVVVMLWTRRAVTTSRGPGSKAGADMRTLG